MAFVEVGGVIGAGRDAYVELVVEVVVVHVDIELVGYVKLTESRSGLAFSTPAAPCGRIFVSGRLGHATTACHSRLFSSRFY